MRDPSDLSPLDAGSADVIAGLPVRLASGAVWSFLLRILDRGSGVVRRIVLARILAPHDFGLFGISLLALATLETFTATGFDRALIQADDTDGRLAPAWSAGLLRGLGLSILLFALGPWISSFFQEPGAESLIRAIALVPLFSSLRNPGVLHLQRDLDFRTQALYEGVSALVNVAITIVYAILTGSVWALVAGLLAGEAVKVALSYVVHPYRPRWSLEGASLRWLFGYGKWVMVSTIFLFLLNQGDDVFLGKVLGASALGYYQMAYMVISAPTTQLTHVVMRVTFPAYRFLRESVERLRYTYLTLVQLTSLLSLPLAVMIFLHARSIVLYVFGETWLPMVPLVQIMAPWGFIRSLGSCAGPLFDGSGRPDITARLTGLKLLTLVVLIVPLTEAFGMEGTAAAVVLAALLNNPVANTAALRMVEGRWSDLLRALVRPFILTGLAAGASLPAMLWIDNPGLASLTAAAVFGGVYGLLVLKVGGEAVARLRRSLIGSREGG